MDTDLEITMDYDWWINWKKNSGSMDNKSKIQLICNSVWQKYYVDPTIMIYLVYDPKKILTMV